MSTDLQLIGRFPGVVDLAIRNDPVYRAYRIRGGLTLDAAFSASVEMMTVPVGQDFRSRALRRSGRYLNEDLNRGLTRIVFDPIDYASATLPSDGQMAFLRLEGIDHAGNPQAEGPILIVPMSGFFGSENIAMQFRGTAPNVAGVPSLAPPVGALWVRSPKAGGDLTIVNGEAALGNSLFVSIAGMPEFEIPAATSFTFKSTGATSFAFRGQGGTVDFRATLALINGIQV